MPLLIHGRCYKTFKAAARAVQRWKRIGEKRASAYTAVVMRRTEGTKRLKLACGSGRGRSARGSWVPKRVIWKGRKLVVSQARPRKRGRTQKRSSRSVRK